jgi:hypothetical protein
MEDEQCPMCKAELDEVVITQDKELDWNFFEKKLMRKCPEDPEDECIHYSDEECKKAGLHLRNLTCLISNCKSN